MQASLEKHHKGKSNLRLGSVSIGESLNHRSLLARVEGTYPFNIPYYISRNCFIEARQESYPISMANRDWEGALYQPESSRRATEKRDMVSRCIPGSSHCLCVPKLFIAGTFEVSHMEGVPFVS